VVVVVVMTMFILAAREYGRRKSISVGASLASRCVRPDDDNDDDDDDDNDDYDDDDHCHHVIITIIITPVSRSLLQDTIIIIITPEARCLLQDTRERPVAQSQRQDLIACNDDDDDDMKLMMTMMM